jgi:hypothetical protein
MKHLVYFTLFLLLAGCAGESAHTDHDTVVSSGKDSPAGDTVTATAPATATGTTTVSVPDTVPPDPLFTARLEFTFTSAYCGGARPTEEIIADKATARPLRNSTLLLKNHFNGKTYTCTTNDDGVCQTGITEGKYDVYLTTDINPKLGTGFDGKCSLWRNKVMYTVKITDDGKSRLVPVHFECNPCDDNMKRRP